MSPTDNANTLNISLKGATNISVEIPNSQTVPVTLNGNNAIIQMEIGLEVNCSLMNNFIVVDVST